ncbi:GNAT family acetyltransferase [Mesobacillus campisalis]|uniref:GNAT family acetyltransferase n=1 Tax=Mesobacillus campisalis TaxID=1408103 RepID=A0A0M2SVH9_9BACI|nr:GNAT family protein [Mesobacillus campisalis]KKK37711.1 GNAT family acetyltransferase [Mesobacillus campisalis]
MKPLENEVVQLLPMEYSHVEGLYKAAQDHRIWEHMSVELLTKEQVVQYVEDAHEKQKKGTEIAYVIVSKQKQKIIGATWFLDISKQHERLEIGSTWISPDHWRTSVNTSCKYLLLKYCFEDIGLNRVQIKTGHKNIRSQKAIERIGAVKEGVLRNHMITRDGSIRHTVMYSITREEWPQIKLRFERSLLN